MTPPYGALHPYHSLLAFFLLANLLAVGFLMAAWALWSDRKERRFSLLFKLSLAVTGLFLWPLIPYWRGQCGRKACAFGYAIVLFFSLATLFLYRGLALAATAGLYEARANAYLDGREAEKARFYVEGFEAMTALHRRHIGWLIPKEAQRLSESALKLRGRLDAVAPERPQPVLTPPTP